MKGVEMVSKNVETSPNGLLSFNFNNLSKTAIGGTISPFGNGGMVNATLTNTAQVTLGGDGNSIDSHEQTAGMIIYGNGSSNDGPGAGYTSTHQYKSIDMSWKKGIVGVYKLAMKLNKLLYPKSPLPKGITP